ncbi:hypothetical protein L7F22_051348 [Adiantum nelumboides]|nr:hypothetical protein [Adiantum nelumboides]
MDSLKLSSFYSLRSGRSLLLQALSPRSSRQRISITANSSFGAEKAEAPGLEKSRGELFLENELKRTIHHGKSSSSTMATAASKKIKKKKKEIVTNTDPSCYGCGAALQTHEAEAPGYVLLDTYELKKKHHQLRTVLCQRCRALAHGQMIPAVGGHGGYAGGKRFITAEQLRMELSHIRDEKALIVNLVDIVDFNGSFLSRIRDVVGANPIVLVATKVDLLPRGTNFAAIGDWILEFLTRKKLNVISVHLTSSKSMVGIPGVVSYLRQQRQGRDVFILGSANVGKSAFVSAMLQELSKRDYAATAALRRLPIQSAMPGTTLGPIEIKAFSSGGSMFDTPGIHVHHRMAAAVSPNDLTLLAPRRQVRGYLVAPSIFARTQKTSFDALQSATAALGGDIPNSNNQVPRRTSTELPMLSDLAGGAIEEEINLSGMSVLWGGFVRLDVVKVPPYVGFRFYGPTSIPKETVPTSEADVFYKEELGKKLAPPTSAEGWSGLESQHTLNLKFDSWNRPACDIAISGFGWMTIECGYADHMEDLEAQNLAVDKTVQVVVHVPRSVEIFVRPSLPIGTRGSEWYEFRELSEKELEARPPVYLP